jgi:hypothetical protein
LTRGLVFLAVIGATVVYVLLAVAKPTRRCPGCDGQRVVVARELFTGRKSTLPCRRCSATGRTPRFGAPTIRRLSWSVRHERNNS